MMTRAAAAMVKLEMQSDELARFLVATIGTSTHSPDAIAKSFELRDPVGPILRHVLKRSGLTLRSLSVQAVLLRLMGRAMESDRKCRHASELTSEY